MNTSPPMDGLKRAISWILTVTLLIQQPLWAASELIALERAQSTFMEGKPLWILPLREKPDKEGTYRWSLGKDLATLDKPLYMGTAKGGVVATILPWDGEKGLLIQSTVPLCVEAIDEALQVPLIVRSRECVYVDTDCLPGSLGIAAPSMVFSKPLRLSHDLRLHCEGPLALPRIIGDGSITVRAKHLTLTQFLGSEGPVVLEGDLLNKGDIYSATLVHLKGHRLIHEGLIRSRTAVREEGHRITHRAGSLVFAGLFHELESHELEQGGEVITGGLSQQRAKHALTYSATGRFRGRQLVMHSSQSLFIQENAVLNGTEFMGLSAALDLIAYGRVYTGGRVPYEKVYGPFAYSVEDMRSITRHIDGYLARHKLSEFTRRIILTAGRSLRSSKGLIETLGDPIEYAGKHVALGSESRAGIGSRLATMRIAGRDVEIDAVLDGDARISTLEALLVDIAADSVAIKGDVKAPVRVTMGGGSAAASASVSGKVMGPLSVTGGSLAISGSVLGDIHADLTRTLTLSGTHEGDLWAKVGELFKVTESGSTLGGSLTLEAGAFENAGHMAQSTLTANVGLYNSGTVEVGGIGELPSLRNTGRAIFSALRYGSDTLDNTGGSITVGQLLRAEGVALLNEGGRAVVGSMTLPAREDYTFTGTTVIGALDTPWHVQRLINEGDTTLLSGGLTVEKETRNSGKLALGKGTFSLGHLHNVAGGEVTLAGRSRIQLFDIRNQGTLHAPDGLRIGQGAWNTSLDQAHQSWAHVEANPHTLSQLGHIEGGELALDLRNSGDLPGYLRTHQGDWAVEGVTLFAPTQDWVLSQALHVPSALSMHIRDYTSTANLSGDRDLAIHGRSFRHGSMKGALTTPGKVRIHVEWDMDNRQGRIWGGSGLQGYAGKRILVGEGIAEGPHWVKRNGAYVASGSDLDLEGVQGIRMNFGEVVALGKGRLATQDELYLNSSLLRMGGKAHIQARSVLAKMNDPITRGASICDSQFWCNQWRQHFTGDSTRMLFGDDVHLELGNQGPGNFTLIGSHLAAMGRVYDRQGHELTSRTPGTLNLRAVELWEHAEKNPGDKWQGTHHKQIGIAHSTFSTSGPVDLTFGTYDLSGAKMAAASVNLKGLQAQMDGRGDQMGAFRVPSVYQDLREGLSRLVGGVTGYRSPLESPEAVYTTGPRALGALPWEHLVIAAPRADQARVQERLQTLMAGLTSFGDKSLPLRFLMDTPTTLAALQETLVRNSLKGYLFAHTDGLGHLTRLTESAKTLAGGSTLAKGRVAILEELEAANAPALVYVLDTDAHGEEILRPVVLRPHQSLDSLLQAPGTSVVADVGPLNLTTQGSQFAIRTNWGTATDLNLTALEGDIIARAIRAKAQAGSMQGRSILIGNDHDVTRSVVCGDGSYRETMTVTSVPSILEMPLFQALATEGDATFQHLHFTGQAFNVDAPKGSILFEMGRNSRYTVQVDQESSMPYNTTTMSRSESHDYSQNQFSPDAILTLNARDGIHAQETPSQKAAFLWDVRTSGASGMAKPAITTEMLYPYSHTETQEHRSLNPGFAALVMVAATIATQGVCGAGMLGAMGDAALGFYAGHTANGMLQHQFNIGRTLDGLTSGDTTRSAARSIATAGVLHGLYAYAELPQKLYEVNSIPTLFARQAVGMAGRTGIGLVARDDPRDLFRREARGFAASMVQGIAARVIGDSALNDDLNPFAQNALHGLAGGGAGYMVGGSEGIAPGAVGAVASHWVAGEAMENGMGEGDAAKLAAMAGSTFGCVADWAQEGTGALGVDIGGRTGAIAAEQNIIPHVFLALMLLYEAGDVAHTYLTQGSEAALKSLGIKLGVSAATIAIGGPLLKGTISALLARSPALAKALGQFGDLLLSASEAGTQALGKTAIGRGILAADAALESAMDRSAQALLSSLGARKGVSVTFKHKPGTPESEFSSLLEKKPPHEVSGYLPAPKMVRHHLFNKFRGESIRSEKYREFFRQHNIDLDRYCVEIPETTHQTIIHKAQNNWTTHWRVWIDNNPNATTKEVYQFAGKMMDEYSIAHVPVVPYR